MMEEAKTLFPAPGKRKPTPGEMALYHAWEITNGILVAAHELHPLDLCSRLDWLNEQADKNFGQAREPWNDAICLTRNGVVYTRERLGTQSTGAIP